jgi:predicted Na+-dependent transporter
VHVLNDSALIIQVIANIGILTFVVAGMAALGLELTLKKIIEPLSDLFLLIRVVVANFLLVPALAYLILFLVPLSEGFRIGLILLATAAGAPFLPKLVQVAKGKVAMSVGVMVLLMVTTVIYVPLVLPLLLPGVAVNPLEIASSLVVLMLLPMVVGLLINYRYEKLAALLQNTLSRIANVGLVLGFVALLALNWRFLLATIGSGAIISVLLLILGAFIIGWLLAGKDTAAKPVLALGTAQRNIAAALVVAGNNFSDPDVLLICMVGALLMLIVLMLGAGELGRRNYGS